MCLMWALNEFYSFSCGLAIIKDQVTKQSKIKSTVHEPNPLKPKCKKLQHFAIANFEVNNK